MMSWRPLFTKLWLEVVVIDWTCGYKYKWLLSSPNNLISQLTARLAEDD